MSSQVNHSPQSYNHTVRSRSTSDSVLQTTASKRPAEDLEFPYPPGKSRRLEFMKCRIRMDHEACNLLSKRSSMAYHYYTTGDYSAAANEYKTFLSNRSWWKSSIKEGGSLIIIQSIFKLARCYIALSQFDQARITIQELHDIKSGTAIGWGHALFNELASLYSEIKGRSAEVQDAIKASLLSSFECIGHTMSCNGKHEAAVQLLSKTLTSLPIDVNNLDTDLKDLLVELHLSLAEGYTCLGQPTAALSTLEKVWNPHGNLCITWGHRLFKKMANLNWSLKKRDG
ncbi:uncharacterized protein PGTG_19722 [Puccinia graminis f. sp. tritici CRL 75-36-700-3]|uniref:Uncharacterized protein n=1 Tax=Puccinia graminis f. sp. tritici (strain CRL 75-36-700-3 / race SCCL) TaxID=418459 RepID=E3LB13_PUCGT|nr:uncharacterized protein PGTG_19722 [Puccinia graminis f. sp. tritici CRL 75-36-700-3]EFP93738.2 hypothetical protein PGTG_19722 [Puccinia graminis f. sp. tritici CRL 75-36-700-3]